MRGWFLSRHHLLSDPVVSGRIPRAGRQLLHAGDPDFIDRRITDIRNVAEPDRLGTGRLAMAVHSRSVAIAPCRTRRAVLPDRFSAPGPMAATRRNRVAGKRAGNREAEQREGRTSIPASIAHGYPYPALRAGVLLFERGKLRRRLFPADHHQGLWGQRYPDRPAG